MAKFRKKENRYIISVRVAKAIQQLNISYGCSENSGSVTKHISAVTCDEC